MDTETASYKIPKPSSIFTPEAARSLLNLYATNPDAAKAQFDRQAAAGGWGWLVRRGVWNGMMAELKKRQQS